MSTETRAFSSRSDPPGNSAARIAGLAASALLVFASNARGQPADDGEPTGGARSVYVLDMPFLHFGPQDPTAPRPGRITFDLETAYGNTFSHTWHAQAIHNETGRNGLPFTREEALTLHERHPQDFIAFVDADVTRVALRATWGLTENLSAAVEIPYVSFAGPRLDAAVESFHAALGLYDGERASFPRDQFLVVRQRPFGRLEYDDRQPTAGLSDLVATLRYRATTGAVRLSADLAIKAPTGAADEARGSGSFDVGLLVGVVGRLGPNRRLGLRSEAGVVLPGPFRGNRITTFGVAPFARLLVAGDVRIGAGTFVSLSAAWEQSPFRRDQVGDESVASTGLTLGISRRIGDGLAVRLAFLENLPHSGDDTDFSIALGVRLGR